MTDATSLNHNDLTNFAIGCIGAIGPEIYRLYNLRTKNLSKSDWPWSYLLYSVLFAMLGGFIAFVLEPTTRWAAFHGGLTTPAFLTTVMKNTAKELKELKEIEKNIKSITVEKEETTKENYYLKRKVKQLKLEREKLKAALPPEITIESLESEFLDDFEAKPKIVEESISPAKHYRPTLIITTLITITLITGTLLIINYLPSSTNESISFLPRYILIIPVILISIYIIVKFKNNYLFQKFLRGL